MLGSAASIEHHVLNKYCPHFDRHQAEVSEHSNSAGFFAHHHPPANEADSPRQCGIALPPAPGITFYPSLPSYTPILVGNTSRLNSGRRFSITPQIHPQAHSTILMVGIRYAREDQPRSRIDLLGSSCSRAARDSLPAPDFEANPQFLRRQTSQDERCAPQHDMRRLRLSFPGFERCGARGEGGHPTRLANDVDEGFSTSAGKGIEAASRSNERVESRTATAGELQAPVSGATLTPTSGNLGRMAADDCAVRGRGVHAGEGKARAVGETRSHSIRLKQQPKQPKSVEYGTAVISAIFDGYSAETPRIGRVLDAENLPQTPVYVRETEAAVLVEFKPARRLCFRRCMKGDEGVAARATLGRRSNSDDQLRYVMDHWRMIPQDPDQPPPSVQL
ncbi:hypothetical protein DFH09DRAFT_1076604 [Mycena vulgaris]|nr:hypothetical protein DFH09DRAFT_1076604 [Mycena vulgaris]